MTETKFDIAVLGSTPLARLLAGLLAQHHGKSVVLVADNQAGFRLPRGVDLSVAPLTRPDSWALLAHSVPETARLLGKIGAKSGMARVDSIFFAEAPAARQALSYIRQVGTGFGAAIERMKKDALGPDRDAIVIRDTIHLQRPLLERALDKWLSQIPVPRYAPDAVEIAVAADGSATLIAGDDIIHSAATILVDDVAIAAHCPADWQSDLFDTVAQATILTEPTQPLAAPVMLEVDSGLFLSQPATKGIVAIAPVPMERLAARLGVLLSAHRRLHRAGQAIHSGLLVRDRAPLIGRKGEGPMLLSGFGPSGAFLAPAIARYLVGKGREEEDRYFAAHAPTRDMAASLVTDFSAVPPTGIAA